jgi:hypothetical protein
VVGWGGKASLWKKEKEAGDHQHPAAKLRFKVDVVDRIFF